ncbi:MAG: aldehyde dehydrogenase family protein, partial [Oxalobacteraceae bacterium]|nr:aldehyde dehydrogenase family protein [Oxalobacteraceae bacterium]
MKTYNHYIDGQYVEPIGQQWMDTINPYTGKVWAKIPQGCAKDVDRAVAAAKRAMTEGPYAKMTPTERGKMMLRLADLVTKHAERLAEIEVQDNGKLMAEMRGQMNYHPEWWRYYGGLADKVEGSVMPIDKPDIFAFTRHEPVGVVGALTAWNSPLLFIAWKCAPAIAAGCSVVIKPSEFTSASTLEYAALTKEAGFPDGVFNVVAGYGPDAGSALVDHPDVAKITFTGSDATGARIYAQAAKTMKRVTLELGGKSPNIVFDDCNLDKAAAGVVSGIFAATGQTCI